MSAEPPDSNRVVRQFLPEVLDKTVIALPLQKLIDEKPDALHEVIIDLNLEFPKGRAAAQRQIRKYIEEAQKKLKVPEGRVERSDADVRHQYVFATLDGKVIRELARLDGDAKVRAIYRIWPDFDVSAFITRSIATVKADAARNSFSALGENITWAVLDTGIDANHKHFEQNQNLKGPVQHRDFTQPNDGAGEPLKDPNGHGTHVAGILAGQRSAQKGEKLRVVEIHRDENNDIVPKILEVDTISGVAPKCWLASLRVLNEDGKGKVRNIIRALDYVQEVNGNGRRLHIHGVNLSLGHSFEPEWFACGQSPLCVEVERLVRSGVVVVVAAGNTGYGSFDLTTGASFSSGMGLSINDPGNADLAITVGSTHRYMPHVYGVSYFSSKGPTGDGRPKPDLVAPGEKIISSATGKLKLDAARGQDCDYVETSGTSMAAPHVSGAIAAFLSIRGEFIGKPERVKEIFTSTATDLKRDRYFQGAGLVDLMRAIQSV
jgi:subtilisin family serine protease